MKQIVAAALLAIALSGCAAAQQQPPRVLTSNGDSIVAFDTPCKWEKFNEALKDQYAGKSRNGLCVGVHVGNIPGCYVEVDEVLLFVFVDGDTYAIPAKEMTRGPIPKPAAPTSKPKGTAI
jgi:hypothetical protein